MLLQTLMILCVSRHTASVNSQPCKPVPETSNQQVVYCGNGLPYRDGWPL